MASNTVSLKFSNYLQSIRKKSNTTVRELGAAIGKSRNYISQLENGKVKKIDFETVFTMLKYLNDKSYLVIGKPEDLSNPNKVLHDFIVMNFDIWSDEYLNKLAEEQERWEKKRIEEYRQLHLKLSRLEALLEPEQEYLVDVVLELLPVVQLLPYYKEYEIKKELQSIIKKYSKEEK